MNRILGTLALLALITEPMRAQTTPARSTPTDSTAAATDTSHDASDDEGIPLGMQYGVATGALHYGAGRSEQALSAMLRWAPMRWFSLAGTVTLARESEPSSKTSNASISRGGLADFPLEATVSHTFATEWKPVLSGGLSMTLPTGDSASGFGAGRVTYAMSAGLGFSPSEQVWVQLGAGRPLSGVSAQSAFTSGAGWGDLSAGTSLTQRVSVSGGFSSDIGSVDPTIGRSASINAGAAYAINGPLTAHINISHGISGAAPDWGFGFGVGTAFPYLGHLGADSFQQLRSTFGSGSHGLTTIPGIVGGRGRP